MKRNFIELAACIALGLLAFYLYISFVGVMFTLTVKAFYLTRDFDQDMRKALFWPFIVSSDIITAIPVFLVIGSILGIIIKKFRWNWPLIVFLSFLSMFLFTDIGFSAPYQYEFMKFFSILVLTILFTKLGQSVKHNRQNLGVAAQQSSSQGFGD